MENKHPLLVFVYAASVLLALFAEILAWIVIPSDVPAAVRFSVPLVFLATAIVLFPAYKRLDSYIALDVGKARDGDELRAGLANLEKCPSCQCC